MDAQRLFTSVFLSFCCDVRREINSGERCKLQTCMQLAHLICIQQAKALHIQAFACFYGSSNIQNIISVFPTCHNLPNSISPWISFIHSTLEGRKKTMAVKEKLGLPNLLKTRHSAHRCSNPGDLLGGFRRQACWRFGQLCQLCQFDFTNPLPQFSTELTSKQGHGGLHL